MHARIVVQVNLIVTAPLAKVKSMINESSTPCTIIEIIYPYLSKVNSIKNTELISIDKIFLRNIRQF